MKLSYAPLGGANTVFLAWMGATHFRMKTLKHVATDAARLEQELMIVHLAKEYSRNLIPITNMIHSKRRRMFVESIEWRNEQ
jgi:membrane protein required for beta-lactamase induction